VVPNVIKNFGGYSGVCCVRIYCSHSPPSPWLCGILLGVFLFRTLWLVCSHLMQNFRYLGAAVISGLLEALSDQNDNLTLPLYTWSMLVIAEV